MKKEFNMLLELLNLDVDKEQYLHVFLMMEKNLNKDFYCVHKHSFLWNACWKFLRGEIELADWLQLGDVDSQQKLYDSDSESSMSFVKSVVDWTTVIDEKRLYLVDKLTFDFYDKELGQYNNFVCC